VAFTRADTPIARDNDAADTLSARGALGISASARLGSRWRRHRPLISRNAAAHVPLQCRPLHRNIKVRIPRWGLDCRRCGTCARLNGGEPLISNQLFDYVLPVYVYPCTSLSSGRGCGKQLMLGFKCSRSENDVNSESYFLETFEFPNDRRVLND